MVQILSYPTPEVKRKFLSFLPRGGTLPVFFGACTPRPCRPPLGGGTCLAELRPPGRAESNAIRDFPGHVPGKSHPAPGAGRLFQRNRGPPRVKSPSDKSPRLLSDDPLTRAPWAYMPMHKMVRSGTCARAGHRCPWPQSARAAFAVQRRGGLSRELCCGAASAYLRGTASPLEGL